MPNVQSGTSRRTPITWSALGALLFPISVAHAQIQVDATVTPLVGSFQYDITVHNAGPEDVVIVSLVDAPTFDALISPSLSAPAGFLMGYDSGLGIVDLFEDSSTFLSGTTVTGFRFQSLALPPANFTIFEAFDLNLDFQRGTVNFVMVPESSTLLAMFAVAGAAGLQFFRWRRSHLSLVPGETV